MLISIVALNKGSSAYIHDFSCLIIYGYDAGLVKDDLAVLEYDRVGGAQVYRQLLSEECHITSFSFLPQ